MCACVDVVRGGYLRARCLIHVHEYTHMHIHTTTPHTHMHARPPARTAWHSTARHSTTRHTRKHVPTHSMHSTHGMHSHTHAQRTQHAHAHARTCECRGCVMMFRGCFHPICGVCPRNSTRVPHIPDWSVPASGVLGTRRWIQVARTREVAFNRSHRSAAIDPQP